MSEVKEKKSIFKKWWFWLIVVIVIAVGAAGANLDNDTVDKNETEKAEIKSENKTTEKTFGIGDTVKVGDMVYTVNKKSTAAQVGPNALPTKAKGKYLVLEVTLKNNEKEAVTVDSSFFKLKRGDKTYEADSMASLSANQKEDGSISNSFFLQQLNPDLELKGLVVFDVSPEIADAKDLKLQVQTGAFGTETGLIDLK